MKIENAIERLETLLAHANMLLEPDAMTGSKPRDISLVLDRQDVGAVKAALDALKKHARKQA